MDAVAIFDDVEVPKSRVFLDGDTVGYSEVISDTGWRGHIMHQAFTRAHVKLSFAFGLGHLIANTTGVGRFDHIQEKLGQMWNMVELTRSALVSACTSPRTMLNLPPTPMPCAAQVHADPNTKRPTPAE